MEKQTNHNGKKPYLIEYRLSEVIALIITLAISENTFRTEDGIKKSLMTEQPKSAESWSNLAMEHPEFFRKGTTPDKIALLIRYLEKADNSETGVKRDILNIDQTQKLVDQAIGLHDRQLSRSQRKGYLVPFYSSILTGAITIIITIATLYFNGKATNDKIEQVNKKIDTLILK